MMQPISRRAERIPHKSRKNRLATIRRSAYPQDYKRENVATEWIDYKKSYGPSNLNKKISKNVKSFITKAMENQNVELSAGRQTLLEVKIYNVSSQEIYSRHR